MKMTTMSSLFLSLFTYRTLWPFMTPSSGDCKLVFLYGIGGLSDVGRHAILAALEDPSITKLL